MPIGEQSAQRHRTGPVWFACEWNESKIASLQKHSRVWLHYVRTRTPAAPAPHPARRASRGAPHACAGLLVRRMLHVACRVSHARRAAQPRHRVRRAHFGSAQRTRREERAPQRKGSGEGETAARLTGGCARGGMDGAGLAGVCSPLPVLERRALGREHDVHALRAARPYPRNARHRMAHRHSHERRSTDHAACMRVADAARRCETRTRAARERVRLSSAKSRGPRVFHGAASCSP